MKLNKQTETEVEVVVSEEEEAAIKKLFDRNIVLYNDNVNTFDHVISCLIDYCEHQPSQAEQCAIIVHNNGKCSVKTGAYEVLEPICKALLENKLSAKIE